MATQDTTQLKEKILSILRTRGPSLPVHISSQIGQSILFTSAFLSELVAEKKIKFSNMKVGSSPVYFIPEQFPKLEKFSEHLKSKEKEAYLLLKEKKFLVDENQEPAIRVALRALKDFAIPFEHNSKLIWRYFTIPAQDYQKPQDLTVPMATKLKIESDEKKHSEQVPQKKVEIFDKKEQEKTQQKPNEKKETKMKKSSKKKSQKKSSKTSDKFFDKIKSTLNQKEIEITDIIGIAKNELTLKIKENQNEKILVAFNKKRIAETDIVKAHQKAKESNLPYIILSKGEPTKKIQNFLEAAKHLDKLEKTE